MSGEPEPCCALNALKIAELEKRMELLRQMNERAVETASNDLRERLHRMNEFRALLEKQSSTFITRTEFFWAITTFVTLLGMVVAGLTLGR